MGHTRKTATLVLVAGLLVALLVSCGEDNGTGPECVNCEFWSKAFGRVGRFPSVSPADPHLIAFVSSDTTAGCTSVGYDHLWIARLPEIEGEDVNYYQVTCDPYYDFEPVWSPDGNTIAFERKFGGGISDIFTVDVTNIDAPGTPVQFTDHTILPISNESPSWVVIGGDTYIAFSNVSSGGNDYDIKMYRYPDRGEAIPLSIDPADFAQDENGVLSYVFKDQQVCGNGSDVLAFSSPDRMKVCDIHVVARSREFPDTTARAEILINSKDSGKKTPYTFRYRPALRMRIEGALSGYCVDPWDSLSTVPDSLNTFLLDFVYYEGAIGFSSDPGVKNVYLDGAKIEAFQTDPHPTDFAYLYCVALGPHSAYAANTTNEQRCSEIVNFEVAAGETTYITFNCQVTPPADGSAPALTAPALAAPIGRAAMSSAAAVNGVWVIDMRGEPSISNEQTFQAFSSSSSLCQPAISPDGRYVAYLVGDGVNRQIGITDVSALAPREPWPQPVFIGLPGSDEDVECWRIPERVEWLPSASGRKIVASISVCRGGDVEEDFEVWIADLSGFLE